MKQSLREIIRSAVRGRVLIPRSHPRKRNPDPNLPHPMYRNARAPELIRAWGGGLTLGQEVLARHPERNGEGAVYIRSERKKRKRGKRGD